MNIEDLNKDDLVILLNTIKSGMTYEEALNTLIPSNQRNIVETLHTLYCTKNHETDCLLYINPDWNSADRIAWLNKISCIINNYKIDAFKLGKLIPALCDLEDIRKDVLTSEGQEGLDVFNKLIVLGSSVCNPPL